MVQSSRSSRPQRTLGGHVAAKQNAPAAKAGHGNRPTSHHHPSSIPNSSDDGGFDDDGPPPKKRKLSIRAKQPLKNQSTLDHFIANQSHARVEEVKPPTQIKHATPHGQLQVQTNGVRIAIEANEDNIAVADAAVRSAPAQAVVSVAVSKQPEKKEDKRTLRSQDEGPRLKSELAVYFNNYEEIVFGVQKEEEFVTVDTTLYVTDDSSKAQHASGSSQGSPPKAKTTTNGTSNGVSNGRGEYNGCSIIDLSAISRSLGENPADPLDDAHFFKSHRRAERREKQLRNIERERAMHEKVQLERLLDGLLGHDWLKVLGITGITDGEARKYEPKRDYFIAEVQALVDKFRLWKEEEKRQRAEKEAAAREAEESQPASDEEEEEEEENATPDPPSSDLNAKASRQLQEETINAVKRSGFKIRLGKSRNNSSAPSTPSSTPMRPPPPPQSHILPTWAPPPEPITSFYAKRHLRDAALSKTRHGRSVTAFGHPVPEMEEREFALPEDFVSEDVLRANARERRRRKRASIADAASGG